VAAVLILAKSFIQAARCLGRFHQQHARKTVALLADPAQAAKIPLPGTAMVFEAEYNQLGNPCDFCATMYYSVIRRVPTINRIANRRPDEDQAITVWYSS
jgi:hypothetical protein